MSRLTLDRLGKRFGAAVAVDAVSLDVRQGELVVLLGPSGCGKTTTLRMVAGFTLASEGDILLDGESILGLPPHRREMGIVFQSYALFPHLNVARNIAFGLEMRGVAAADRRSRVEQMLRLARLEPYADRLPRQLSGGQQQRVALARALAIQPRVLLLDEPLSNLDAALRGEVGRDIRLLQRQSDLTTIMVTHDQDEAMAMADRLVVMKEGRVQQIGTQEDLYERPGTAFVASFIGRSNMVAGALRAGAVLETDGASLRLAARYAGGGACTLALRPERVRIASRRDDAPERSSGPGSGHATGTVELASYLGPVAEHLIRVGSGQHVVVRESTAGGARLHEAGASVRLLWSDDAERLFDADGAPLDQTSPESINRKVNADA